MGSNLSRLDRDTRGGTGPWNDSSRDERAHTRVRRGAKALFSSRNRVLLVNERRDDGSTFWTLPGGGIRPDESPTSGLRRELAEELQCRARITDPVDVCTYQHRSVPATVTVYLVFAGELVSEPRPNPGEGVIDCRWIEPTKVPDATLSPVRRMLQKHADGSTIESRSQ